MTARDTNKRFAILGGLTIDEVLGRTAIPTTGYPQIDAFIAKYGRPSPQIMDLLVEHERRHSDMEGLFQFAAFMQNLSGVKAHMLTPEPEDGASFPTPKGIHDAADLIAIIFGPGSIGSDGGDTDDEPEPQMQDEAKEEVIDDFSKHEVLHTTHVMVNMFDREIADHEYTLSDPELEAAASRVAEALAALYVLVGSKTL